MDTLILANAVLFLSTLSLRRATGNESGEDADNSDFYPRSPCGERRVRQRNKIHNGNFYPRSPCGERRKSNKLAGQNYKFLSTLSLRRATPGKVRIFDDILDFYPRSPCGERQGEDQH